MGEKYSAAWVKEQLADKTWLPHHDCSLCGVWVGYPIHGDEVSFRSGCGCSWSPSRPSSYGEIAEWLAMQRSDEMRDKIMSRAEGAVVP